MLHALQVMSDNQVGADAVLDGEHLVGIFPSATMRAKVILKGKASERHPRRKS